MFAQLWSIAQLENVFRHLWAHVCACLLAPTSSSSYYYYCCCCCCAESISCLVVAAAPNDHFYFTIIICLAYVSVYLSASVLVLHTHTHTVPTQFTHKCSFASGGGGSWGWWYLLSGLAAVVVVGSALVVVVTYRFFLAFKDQWRSVEVTTAIWIFAVPLIAPQKTGDHFWQMATTTTTVACLCLFFAFFFEHSKYCPSVSITQGATWCYMLHLLILSFPLLDDQIEQRRTQLKHWMTAQECQKEVRRRMREEEERERQRGKIVDEMPIYRKNGEKEVVVVTWHLSLSPLWASTPLWHSASCDHLANTGHQHTFNYHFSYLLKRTIYCLSVPVHIDVQSARARALSTIDLIDDQLETDVQEFVCFPCSCFFWRTISSFSSFVFAHFCQEDRLSAKSVTFDYRPLLLLPPVFTRVLF